MPPVSTASKCTPHHSAGCAMTSRVVPAMGVTIARRFPVMRLNSVDLPTLGRPTSTTDGWRRGINQGEGGRWQNPALCLLPPNLIGSVRIAEPDSHGPAVGQRDLLDKRDRRSVAGGIADHRVGLAHLEEVFAAEPDAAKTVGRRGLEFPGRHLAGGV